MPLPSIEHQIYPRNTLANVVCQFRFPAILRIESEAPAIFQEKVRGAYPMYGMMTLPGIPNEIQGPIREIIGAALQQQMAFGKNHTFSSADGFWKLNLAKDSLALTCTRYPSWEEFSAKFNEALEVLIEVYQPAFFNHVSLRYSNVISRASFKVEDKPWRELLNSSLIAELSDTALNEEEVVANRHNFQLRLDQGSVAVQHGLGTSRDLANTTATVDKVEQVYILDNTFQTEGQMERDDATRRLAIFHEQSGRLYRWCISPFFATVLTNGGKASLSR